MKRTLSLLLALIMTLAVFCSCASDDADADETTPADVTSDTTSDVVTTAPVVTDAYPTAAEVLGARDFGQKQVHFLSRIYNGLWRSDLMAEADTGDTLKSAIFRRNTIIEEEYNLELVETPSPAKEFYDKVETYVKNNDRSFDALVMGLTDAARAAQCGVLYDLTGLENINLTGEWWNQSLNGSWTVGGRQFFAVGDISTIDNMAVRSMYFNKSLYNELQFEDTPYELVTDNKWTMPVFFEKVEKAGMTVGDGSDFTQNQYGLSAQVTLGFMMLMGAGEMLCTKDEDDLPVVSINNDRSLLIIDYLTSNIGGNPAVYTGADDDEKGLFTSGHALFLAEVMSHMETFRSFDLDFGVLPMPKYNAKQKEYYQYATGNCTIVYCFPNNCNGDALDRATFAVEALAIESIGTVTPAYYDVCMKSKYAKDEESGAMLDIIFTNVLTDYAEIYGWGNLKSALQDAMRSGGNVSSVIERNTSVTKTALDATVAKLLDAP